MVNNIQITRNERLQASELNDLFRTNNWQIEPVEKLEKSLQTIWGCVSARTQDKQLIGYVQAISDGIRHVYIMHMIVHPDFRKQGIGSMIMEEFMKMIKESNLMPTLVATPGNDKFYAKFGFKSNCNGLVAMCIR